MDYCAVRNVVAARIGLLPMRGKRSGRPHFELREEYWLNINDSHILKRASHQFCGEFDTPLPSRFL